jgi:hypothetical protein
MHHSPDTLLKADEPAYLATVVIKENGKVHIDEYGYVFTSESDLGKTVKKIEERMKGYKKTDDYEVAYVEIKNGTTGAINDIFKRYGVKVNEPEHPSKDEWSIVLDRLVSLAKGNSFIKGLYLTGSLARGAPSSKDADVLMHASKCPGFSECEVFRRLVCSDLELMNKRVHKPDTNFEIRKQAVDGEKGYSLDVFCFEGEEFKKLERGNYRIAQNKKTLFQRQNQSR